MGHRKKSTYRSLKKEHKPRRKRKRHEKEKNDKNRDMEEGEIQNDDNEDNDIDIDDDDIDNDTLQQRKRRKLNDDKVIDEQLKNMAIDEEKSNAIKPPIMASLVPYTPSSDDNMNEKDESIHLSEVSVACFDDESTQKNEKKNEIKTEDKKTRKSTK